MKSIFQQDYAYLCGKARPFFFYSSFNFFGTEYPFSTNFAVLQ